MADEPFLTELFERAIDEGGVLGDVLLDQATVRESLLEGFTGVIKDKLGRERHYENGKQVKGPEEGKELPPEDHAKEPKTEPVSPQEAQARLAALPAMPGGGKSFALAPFEHVEEFPFDGKALNQALDKYDVSEETVPLDKLITEQVGVERRGVQHYLDDPAKESTSEEADPRYSDGLIVVRTAGKLYLVDGNHRGTAAVLRGMKTMKAYVVELPAVQSVRESLLEGFTGTVTDKLGRVRHYVDGKPVKSQEDVKAALSGTKDTGQTAGTKTVAAAPASIADAYQKLQQAQGGGRVKVPDLFDAAKEANPGLTLEDFHKQLLDLEQQDLLSIGQVNDPRLEPRYGEMIPDPRGQARLGYVLLRPGALEALRAQG